MIRFGFWGYFSVHKPSTFLSPPESADEAIDQIAGINSKIVAIKYAQLSRISDVAKYHTLLWASVCRMTFIRTFLSMYLRATAILSQCSVSASMLAKILVKRVPDFSRAVREQGLAVSDFNWFMASYTSMPAVETNPSPQFSEKKRSRAYTKRVIALLVFLGVIIITVVILQWTISLPGAENVGEKSPRPEQSCTDSCTIGLVESIPVGVSYPHGSPRHPPISDGWLKLIDMAQESIDIASFYWTLRGNDTGTDDPSTKAGENVFQGLIDANKERGEMRSSSFRSPNWKLLI